MKSHGYGTSAWPPETKEAITKVHSALKEATISRVCTALELDGWSAMKCCAKIMHGCPLTRELSRLRLRISPQAELSGLGSASVDGGHLVQIVQRAVQVVTEAS